MSKKKKLGPLTNLQQIHCPYCRSTDILIIVDFSKKRQGKDNIAICVKKVHKNIFSKITITGCSKTFKIEFIDKVAMGIIDFPTL
jgi:hypothetical protein